MKYEFRTTEGTTCCSSDNPDYLYTHCKAALAREHAMPDPYALPIEALRTAMGITPRDTIADDDPGSRRCSSSVIGCASRP